MGCVRPAAACEVSNYFMRLQEPQKSNLNYSESWERHARCVRPCLVTQDPSWPRSDSDAMSHWPRHNITQRILTTLA